MDSAVPSGNFPVSLWFVMAGIGHTAWGSGQSVSRVHSLLTARSWPTASVRVGRLFCSSWRERQGYRRLFSQEPSEDEEVLTGRLLHSNVSIGTSGACGEPKWRLQISCEEGAETAEYVTSASD